ncbi:thiamine ABC transporter substrate-binding protein [Natronorubrum thiooxidans]|uniref:Thiamine transport system substrate-binding protein n=1 Tax=Natronorubrum thiooxidans TaxID=308853 RepID=A0A1N7C8V5_9EURY|nr:thiamine ABC transporter substrate-binding protein [Natronorubrum thiooxidans]SIR60005.1 thiamine transport system substrate-binding protein [Natronorubrum thiooxidans]
MNRRTFVGAIGGGAVLGGAGCLTQDGDSDDADDGTLTVVTYESMIDEESAAGPWLKDAFEDEHPDVELEWELLPDQGINYYIERADQDMAIDADVYLGLNVDDLVSIDDNLADGGLFQALDGDRLDRADRVRSDLDMGDPHDRVLPYDTGYISLVYDETEVDEPETFDDLIDPEYENALLAQNAQRSDPGQAFLLWTIDAFGEDGYLDYWQDLDDNGIRILDDWTESYSGAYMEEERPMVVSYSTDQVFANEFGYDFARHQVAFLSDQGYANPEGMGIFDDATNADLAYDFFDFVLSNAAQAEIAQRNVQFPAVEDEYVDLDEEFDEYAHVPPETVSLGYDQLQGNLDRWVDDWAREFASQ